MKNIFSAYLKNEEGATAVEFAMIGVLFISLLASIYAVGVYFLTLNRLQYGTEVAARYASIHDDATASDLEEIVMESLDVVSGDPALLDIAVEDTSSNGINFTEVVSTYRFSWSLPFFAEELSSLSITARSRTAVN